MASDCLVFSQGQMATLTAQFVSSPSGMSVDVPDAKVSIIGSSGAIVLEPTTMTQVMTGFYYYDWVVPNSLPVATYTVRYSGTVIGVATAATEYLKVLPAGTPTDATLSDKKVELMAALETYIGCSQRIPVYNELARRNKDKDVFSLTWPRWNLGNHIIKLNDNEIDTGFAIDFDLGLVRFDKPLHDSDRIYASYNFRWFTDIQLLQFLSDALSQINLEAPGTGYTLDTVPNNYVGVLMLGASKNAIKSMLFCLQFQEQSTIFGGKEQAKDVISNLEKLKENNEEEFKADKKQIKRAVYPKTAMVVTPEYTLPGGRSRWFRYLFSSGVS